ncbi:MAG TPA: hypothetical protein VFT04_10815 [Gemmatimonadales bacterium]|nr:hypothetical protein [Gemmatimonadales bacterium]
MTVPDLEGTESPASGVPVVAVPYDRDSVIAALEATQSSPRPHTSTLDSLFAQFRGPFIDHFRAGQALAAVRDSVERGQAGDSALAAATRRAEATRQALDSAREALAAGDSLRADVRSWENSTYRSFDSVVKALAERARRKPVVDTTDATGLAELRLPASDNDWWLTARSWDVTDPNSSWTWSVRVDADSVELNGSNGRRRPRY